MRKKKMINWRSLKILFSFFSLIFCIIGKPTDGYDFIFLIPMVYFFCTLFTRVKDIESNNNIGYISINILSFLKYSLMPFVIVCIKDYYTGILTSQLPSVDKIFPSILLCCIECLAIHIIIHIFYKYHKIENSSTIQKRVRVNFFMVIFFVISLSLIILYKDSFFPRQLFIINENFQNVSINASLDGLIKIIFYLFKVLLLLYSTQYFLEKYKEKKSFIYIVGIFLSLIIYLALNTSTSRWGLVLPILVYVFILRHIWFSNVRNKIIIYSIGIILGISFISISLFKFNWLFNNNESTSARNILYVFGAQLQEYLSGPRAIAQGIETIELYRNDITFKTCINDFTGSIPFISQFVNQNNRINVYYNYLIKGKNRTATQIMPMITIGAAYFSYALCYVFVAICIFLCLHYGSKEKKANNLFFKYMYSLISIRFALCIGFNTQIIFAWYVSNFIPFILIMVLNNKITSE